MKSNVCKIEKGNSALSAILNESQKVAEYNAFTNKQALQLRLLCEELDGMLPRLMDNYEGEFWIDYEGNVCKITGFCRPVPTLFCWFQCGLTNRRRIYFKP